MAGYKLFVKDAIPVDTAVIFATEENILSSWMQPSEYAVSVTWFEFATSGCPEGLFTTTSTSKGTLSWIPKLIEVKMTGFLQWRNELDKQEEGTRGKSSLQSKVDCREQEPRFGKADDVAPKAGKTPVKLAFPLKSNVVSVPDGYCKYGRVVSNSPENRLFETSRTTSWTIFGNCKNKESGRAVRRFPLA